MGLILGLIFEKFLGLRLELTSRDCLEGDRDENDLSDLLRLIDLFHPTRR
ncbi:MAG: hypothetical protein HC916_18060 [Coleofasciculaceae cyanobacterium SM2_1_6]|nr:hypothetical protein [Coleofasciculaceae cyanobacterium SM2_1_6]